MHLKMSSRVANFDTSLVLISKSLLKCIYVCYSVYSMYVCMFAIVVCYSVCMYALVVYQSLLKVGVLKIGLLHTLNDTKLYNYVPRFFRAVPKIKAMEAVGLDTIHTFIDVYATS